MAYLRLCCCGNTGGLKLVLYDLSKMAIPNNPTQWPGCRRVYSDGDEPQDGNHLLLDPAKDSNKRKSFEKAAKPGEMSNKRQRKDGLGDTSVEDNDGFGNAIAVPSEDDDSLSDALRDALCESDDGGLDDAPAEDSNALRNAIVIPADYDGGLRDAPHENSNSFFNGLSELYEETMQF